MTDNLASSHSLSLLSVAMHVNIPILACSSVPGENVKRFWHATIILCELKMKW